MRTDVRSIRDVLEGEGASVRDEFPWLCFGQPRKPVGWKIHLSGTTGDCVELVRRSVPMLIGSGQAFKVAATPEVVTGLNSGLFGPTQVGKAITIYVDDEDSAAELAVDLDRVTADLTGPEIPFELRIGQNVFARFGAFTPDYITDRLGRSQPSFVDEHGQRVVDARANPRQNERPGPFSDLAARVAAARCSTDYRDRSGATRASHATLLGPGYLLLDTLRSTSKGSVHRALDLRCQSSVNTVLIKRGRAFTACDAAGRSMGDRLRSEFGLLELVKDRCLAPKPVDLFSDLDATYLVAEHLEGSNLEHFVSSLRRGREWWQLSGEERATLRDLLVKTVELATELHAAGVIHRDLAPGNLMVLEDASLRLLDFELAHHEGDASPFGGFTPGFASPGQLANEDPCFADDWYSIAAVATFVVTGLDPAILPVQPGQDLLRWLVERSEDLPPGFVAFVAACLDPDAGVSVVDAVHLVGMDGTAPTPPRRDELRDAARRAVVGLVNGCAMNEGRWLSQNLDHSPSAFQRSGSPVERPDAATGAAGALYAIARAHQLDLTTVAPTRSQLTMLEQSIDLPGLHYGTMGVAWACDLARSCGIDGVPDGAPPEFDGFDWYDLTHGAAGIGLAAVARRRLGTGGTDLIERAAEYLVDCQDDDGGWTTPEGVDEMVGQRYFGSAHGAAGILHFLGAAAHDLQSDRWDESISQGLDWLMGYSYEVEIAGERARRWSWSPDQDDEWNHWCHGSAGIAMVLLSLSVNLGRPDLAEWADEALRVQVAPVYRNLSQCHGLSGLGEAYLSAAEVLDDRRYDARAEEIARALLARAADLGDRGLVWTTQSEATPTADLMTGSGGVAHFLVRICGEGLIGPPLHEERGCAR
ncbi:MAG: lanthionine synthetase LanC family protein [Actinomycetota bacterium]